MNVLKKVAKKVENSKIVKNPKFLVIGLIIIVVLITLIYFIFLKYSPIMNFKYEGYAISGKEITENLLSGDSSDNNSNSNTNKNIELTKIEEQGTIFKKLNDYFVGNKEKTEINLNYPIYINGNSSLYNLSEGNTLISKDFEEISGYPNLSISEGKIYDGNNLERADAKEYIFVKTTDNIYINLYEIKVKTTANEYTIPVNSIIAFTENTIRYYSINNNVLVFNQINDIDNNSNVEIVENSYTYEELLTRLGILQDESNNTENSNSQENIIQENTTNEEVTNDKENIDNDQQNEDSDMDNQNQNGYIKPEVTVDNFTAEVYTAKSTLHIKDPSGRIVEAPTFEIYKDGKIYLRRTFSNSGDIQITGLIPNTEYEIVGKYVYLNENGQKVENTFYEGSFTTKGYEELGSIDITKENGEIYSNKIQLTKVKITSDLNAEAIKGINQVEIETGEIRTVLKNSQVNELLQGKEITIESSEGLKSDSKINYTIKFYDKNGIELKVNNNIGETRTSKGKPTARITMKEQNIVSVTLRLNLTNKDNVELENYKYVVTRPNGEVVQEKRLAENETELLLEDLDQNQYYKIGIYADYDLNDNKGKQENVEIGNLVFATQPISTLGSLELTVENKELTSTTSTISYKINEDRTDKRLIQILNELTINIIEQPSSNEDNTADDEESREGTVVYTYTLTGEEITNLQQAGTKEIKYENLESNTKYTIEITGNVQLGNTQEEIPITYSYKEFTTLKIPAKVEIRNQFVTGNLIDFDVRIEDINNAVLNNKVRMELRNSSEDLIDLQEITTNEDYIRKTYEKLEENKTYKLSFYADQYNEGSTDETYKVNYLIKEIEIVTEPNILGDLKLVSMEKQGTGKNLIDVESKNNWWSKFFNTSAYYGKEYIESEQVLKLYAGKNDTTQYYTYDLTDYIGQNVTISFKAKIEGDMKEVLLLRSKTTKGINITDKLNKDTYVELQETIQIDDTGYIGFRVGSSENDAYLLLKDLQIELGDKKTEYEEFRYVQKAQISVQIENKQEELVTDKYYIRTYKNNKLVNEEEYENLPNSTTGITLNNLNMELENNTNYKLELIIKVHNREYILATQDINSNDKELKGISTIDEFCNIQPDGNYIITNNLVSTGKLTADSIHFNGHINFDGYKVTVDFSTSTRLINYIGNSGLIENLVLDVHYPESAISWNFALCYKNYGTIKNIIVNINETYRVENAYIAPIGQNNYGILENFVINMEEPLYISSGGLGGTFLYNLGTIKNGYVYGENIQVLNSINDARVGCITQANDSNAKIENVYSLITAEVEDGDDTYYIGNVVESSSVHSSIKNVYTTNVSDNIKNGPNVPNNVGTIENSYYFSDKVFANSSDKNTTKLALKDIDFQNRILNSENVFNVDGLIEQGYYPQLNMSDCMPAQEYINLPEIEDADLVDVISSEVLEQNSDSAKVKFNVNNPSGETITNIEIENLKCEIISQEYSSGKTEVIANLKEPIIYVSSYDILSITSKGVFNEYTREFTAGERNINVDLYRKIYSIDDWKEISKYPTENYILENDLDFRNATNFIIQDYRGILNGNGHTIKNINISGSNAGGLITNLYGKIKNLYVENLINDNNTDRKEQGFVRVLSSGAVIENVHIKNSNSIRTTNINGTPATGYIGILVGQSTGGRITDSSVTNSKITTNGQLDTIYAGGLVGNGSYVEINNSYTNNVDIIITDAIETAIGGIIGNENNLGNISNCYAHGSIKSDNSNLGGIAGKTKGTIKNNFSFVNISSSSDNIGGIVGNNSTGNNYYVEKNLAIGNIYSSSSSENIGNISGNLKSQTENYAYEGQLINGYKNISGGRTLTFEELIRENTYLNYLEMQNLNFEKIKEGILPKLYNSTTNELLPNQEDINLKSDNKFNINNIDIEKINNDTVNIRLEIENLNEAQITDINIEDMETEITRNITSQKITYIEITGKPQKYYDSYRLSKIIYLDNAKEQEENVEMKLNVQFYKEIYTFEDWQSIDEEAIQNYRIMSDIDFSGKINIKNKINVSRFDGNNHVLKNISLELDNNSALINFVQNEIKDITFENIEINSENATNNIGIILRNSGRIENIVFKDININAPKASYVAPISRNESMTIENINLNNIEIVGKSYIGGLIGRTIAGNFTNIVAEEININSESYVGGIFGYMISQENSEIKDVTINNSEIVGTSNRVGGIVGTTDSGTEKIIWFSNINMEDNTISGKEYVGGISGYLSYCRHIISKNNNINGTNYVGGIAGQAFTAYDLEVTNLNLQSTGNYTGGLFGSTYDVGKVNNAYVNDSKIISTGDYVGGINGRNDRELADVYVENSEITGRNNVGGIAGINNLNITRVYVYNCKIVGTNNIGGIIGNIIRGSISFTYNNAIIVGTSNIGGIIGYFPNTGVTSTNNNTNISYNYVSTSISGSNNIGGLFGKIDVELYNTDSYFKGNYFEIYITTEDESTSSPGVGSRKIENSNLLNTYIYKYGTINGKNIDINSNYFTEDKYLVEEDLKNTTTYTSKLLWSTRYWNFDSLQNNKYPLLSNTSYLLNQTGIDLPKDEEHIIGNEADTNSLENEMLTEEVEQTFEYDNKEIMTYSTYSVITAMDGTQVTRNAKLYVKDNTLYAIPSVVSTNEESEIVPVADNLILDRYNGKEYETVLGSDGKIYDLKEPIEYPENFLNSDIESIGNNLNSDEKEVEVTYKNGDKIKFNYQTGEIISSSEANSEKTGLFDYLKEKIAEIGDTSANEVSQDIITKYEESKELQTKLEETSVEEAIEKQNIANAEQEIGGITTTENNVTNNSLTENKYISMYNEETGQYEIYNEEELLDTTKEEVVSENEKIEANNLSEYYASEGETKNTKMGIVWIVISIIGVGIILFVLRKNLKKKNA